MGHLSPDPQTSAPANTSPFETHDPDFLAVLGDSPRLERVVPTDAHEGPVYAADEDALYFTTLPRTKGVLAPGFPQVAIKRVALDGDRFPVGPDRVSVVMPSANAANGMALGRDGRLIVCEQGTPSTPARISALDPASGQLEVLADNCNGQPLSSPNDVVETRDGSIWFTDPSYGWLQGFRPRPAAPDRVYRRDPSGEVHPVAESLDKPNGLAFSPDESVLYVTDSGANQEPDSLYPERPHHIVAFDVVGSAELAAERVLAEVSPGFPDGIKCDAQGRVYSSSFSGVQVFSPGGERIGEIALPGAVNFTFGGRDRNVLFITTDTAVCAAELEAKGA